MSDTPSTTQTTHATEAQTAELPPAPSAGEFLGTGRRKTAVARVRLRPGNGKVTVNRKELETYFTEPQEHAAVLAPLKATKTLGSFDVLVNVQGGGHNGQSQAVLLGMARALASADERFIPVLRDKGYMTRDSRVVERKKYGHRKARRRFQFSKR